MKSLEYDLCIVGGGLSGLSVASFVGHQRPELRLLVLEQATTPGGAITTYNESGYLAEWGPHGFLDNCAESRHLVELAGLQHAVTTAPLSRFVRYLCLNGRLQCIPQKPLRILREPLMPWKAKLRILADLWKKPLPGEPTVAQWVEHRFGKALLPFADAVYTGTYAGDIHRLKIDAVMPGVRGLEQKHGSVIRGVLQARREARKHGKNSRKGLPAMTSFKDGMAMLPQRLAADLVEQGSLAFGNRVLALARVEQGWRVIMEQGEVICRHLVLALPVNQGLALVAAALPSMPPPLPAIPEARILSVLLGFDTRAGIPFGFGYLAPEQEARFALGALFSSHMFPGRAPEGHHLVEALVGGRRHPERLDLSDNQLITEVCRDLGRLMDLPAPSFATVLRSQSGIPQLEAGYEDLLAWRRQVHAVHPDLHLCGFGWKGIGINDMVKEAARVAAELCTHGVGGESTEVKGVYF